MSDFNEGPDQWIAPAGSNYQRTMCDAPIGKFALGGLRTESPGTLMRKEITNLPMHTNLLISFTFLFLGTWDARYPERTGFLNLDNTKVWKPWHAGREYCWAAPPLPQLSA